MSNLERLANADFNKQWLCINDKGELDVVNKDNRFLRAWKTILGKITGHNYYENIYLPTIANRVVSLARPLQPERNITCYAETASKVAERLSEKFKNREMPQHQELSRDYIFGAFKTILAEHPQICLFPNGSGFSCQNYTYETRISPQERSLAQECRTLADQLNVSKIDGLDATHPLCQFLGPKLAEYPKDRLGNRWVNYRCHLIAKVNVPIEQFKQIYDDGYELKLPAWGDKGVIVGEQTFFIPKEQKHVLASRENRPSSIEVIVVDREANIEDDGTATLPGNLMIEMHNNISKAGCLFSNGVITVELIPPPNLFT